MVRWAALAWMIAGVLALAEMAFPAWVSSVAAGQSGRAAAVGVLPWFGSSRPKPVARVDLVGDFTQMAVADLNGDGRPDVLLTAQNGSGTERLPVIVLLNDGRGGLSDRTAALFFGDVPSTVGASQIVVADFNGDGRSDVFISDAGDDKPPFPGAPSRLILSAPGGRLVDASRNLPAESPYSASACAADVNGDGHTDLYVSNIFSGDGTPPRLLLNDGTGHFRIGTGLDPGLVNPNFVQNRYSSCAFADVNGDGSPDLVLGAEGWVTDSAVFLNDGIGNFRFLPHAIPAKPLEPQAIADGIAVTDLNHDGRPDLLIAFSHGTYMGNWVQVLVNNGDGSFRDETDTRLPQTDDPRRTPIAFLQILDLNHDGNPDLGVHYGNGFNDPPLFYTSDRHGVFHLAGTFGLPPGLWALTDLNGDGRLDAVLADQQKKIVSVALQPRPTTKVPKCRPGQKPSKTKPCHK